MLPQDTITAFARELYTARKTRTAVRHFSQRFPAMDIADGYAIQRAWVALELADGRVIKGRKIGLTSRAMQQASQIDEPDMPASCSAAGGSCRTRSICAGSARCCTRTA